MELYSYRKYKNEETTISTLIIADQHFYILEDKDRGLTSDMPLSAIRNKKIKTKTAIPTGRYELAWTWSPSFKKYTLQLLYVPGFDGIRIHVGNCSVDTDGCLLPGLKTNNSTRIYQSTKALELLESLVCPLLKTQKVYLTIKDDPALVA